jgi:YidC/Oxa1 family membrane protein insertase
MFETIIVKPIFNLLVLIYSLLPGHNFGLAIIIFTIVIRFLMWPVLKKQLHQTKAMRELQPELKKIKQAAKGDKQKESLMMMELYKERKINPFGSIGTMIIQLIILIGLYSGLRRVVENPQALIDYSYGWVQNFGWLRTLATDIGRFDDTLFGVVDLSRAAIGRDGSGVYFPALLLVIGSATIQFFQSKQLMPQDKDARGLRQILKEAAEGKSADSSETNAAVGRSMRYFIPIMIFVFTVGLASALSLYWFVSGLVAYMQQSRVLRQDTTEMEAIADKATGKNVIEGEVIPPAASQRTKKQPRPKRRKRK